MTASRASCKVLIVVFTRAWYLFRYACPGRVFVGIVNFVDLLTRGPETKGVVGCLGEGGPVIHIEAVEMFICSEGRNVFLYADLEALSDSETRRSSSERMRQIHCELTGRARRPRNGLESRVFREGVLGF